MKRAGGPGGAGGKVELGGGRWGMDGGWMEDGRAWMVCCCILITSVCMTSIRRPENQKLLLARHPPRSSTPQAASLQTNTHPQSQLSTLFLKATLFPHPRHIQTVTFASILLQSVWRGFPRPAQLPTRQGGGRCTDRQTDRPVDVRKYQGQKLG